MRRNLLLRQPQSIPENYLNYPMTKWESGLFLLFGWIIAALICQLFYRQLLLSFLFFPLIWRLRNHAAQLIANRRSRKLSDQFRDLLYALSSSVASGRHMAEALEDARGHLAILYGKEGLIVMELDQITHKIRESRAGTEALLMDFANRSGLEDIRNFADSYSICLSTGGDLDRVMMRTSQVMLEKIEIQKEIRVMTAQKILETRIMSLIPLGILFLLQLTAPSYLDGMYSTYSGRLIMTLALVLLASSFFLSQKIVNIEV